VKVFFDTEFIEDGKTIDLISIGIVCESRLVLSYYAEFAECDLNRASPWVQNNVIPHLTRKTTPRAKIAESIAAIVGNKPEFWAYYADYDWVALCQLYGTMMDLPKGWPKYCRDVKQLCDSMGNPRLPAQDSTEHNALNDARWTRDAYLWLMKQEPQPAAKENDHAE